MGQSRDKFGRFSFSTGTAAKEQRKSDKMAAHYDKWEKGLSTSEKNALRNYTNQGSGEINEGLISGQSTQSLKRKQHEIQGALQKAPAPPDGTTVFRGASSIKPIESARAGDVVKLDGFQSSSTKASTVKDFAGDTGVMMRIKPKSGAFLTENTSSNPHEREFLLPHGRKYKINKIFKEPSGLTLVDMTEVE